MKIFVLLLSFFLLFSTNTFAQNPYQINTSATNVKENNTELWVQPLRYNTLQTGLRFMVLPAVKGSAYELNFHSKSKEKPFLVKDFGGKIFVYKEHKNFRKDDMNVNEFYFDCEGEAYYLRDEYPDNGNKILRWNEPSIVWLDEIDSVKQKLEGKTVWINTNRWKYEIDGSIVYKNNPERFSKITILQVGVGSYSNYPVRVLFRNEKDQKQYFVDGHVSGTLGFLNYGEDNLQSMISFSPPEKQYPAVRKEYYSAIKNREIVNGMNEAECYLSLGDATNRDTYTKGKDKYVSLGYKPTDSKPYYLNILLKNDKVTEISKSE